MEASPSNANSGLVFVNFNQDFGCFVAVTSEGFRIFNADPLRQNKTECKSFMALAESVKNDGENTSVYLGPAINDVVAGKSRVVKVKNEFISDQIILCNVALVVLLIFLPKSYKWQCDFQCRKWLQWSQLVLKLFFLGHPEPRLVFSDHLIPFS